MYSNKVVSMSFLYMYKEPFSIVSHQTSLVVYESDFAFALTAFFNVTVFAPIFFFLEKLNVLKA